VSEKKNFSRESKKKLKGCVPKGCSALKRQRIQQKRKNQSRQVDIERNFVK
jgi:hypothetical protein